MNTLIDLIKVEEESLSPESYLNLNEKEKANISFTKIIPARIGKSDFGKIHVVYRNPTYKKAK